MSRWRVWFGLLGGGIAWTFHLLATYAIGEFGCVSNLFAGRGWLGIAGIAWMLIGVSIPAILLAAAATWVAYRDDRQLQAVGAPVREARGEDVGHGMGDTRVAAARTGWIMNAIFLYVILVQCIPIIYWREGC
jgi:hypothetical protein